MGSLRHPVGTVLSPCDMRCWISLRSFYQHEEDHDLHRLQVTYLKLVAHLLFFLNLIFLLPLPPSPFLFRFIFNPSCAFWRSSSCHDSGLIPPDSIWGWLGLGSVSRWQKQAPLLPISPPVLASLLKGS